MGDVAILYRLSCTSLIIAFSWRPIEELVRTTVSLDAVA